MTDRREAAARASKQSRKRRLKREARLRVVYALAVRQEGRCALRGQPLDENPSVVHLDHKIPFRITGDAKGRGNLQLVHAECNQEKSDTPPLSAVLGQIQPIATDFITVERRADDSFALTVKPEWRTDAEKIAEAVGPPVPDLLAAVAETRVALEFRNRLHVLQRYWRIAIGERRVTVDV